MPAWYLDEPFLSDADMFFLRAFGDLNTCRPSGMGAGYIPWDKAMEYAQRQGMDAALADAFWLVIREMDGPYLDWQERQAERVNKMKNGRIGNTTKSR